MRNYMNNTIFANTFPFSLLFSSLLFSSLLFSSLLFSSLLFSLLFIYRLLISKCKRVYEVNERLSKKRVYSFVLFVPFVSFLLLYSFFLSFLFLVLLSSQPSLEEDGEGLNSNSILLILH